MTDRQQTVSMSANKMSASTLNVTFPKKQKKFIQSLGGFLKLNGKKSTDVHCRTGKMIFPSSELADKALSRTDLPDGVTLKRCGLRPKQNEQPTDRLKVTGIPVEADISDVASLFPAATSITIRDLRRTGFLIGSVHQYRQKFGREAIVEFDSVEKCQETFRKLGDAQISGKKVDVKFNCQMKKKLKKSVRRKQRKVIRRK